jgi:hypothetical protein
MRHTLNEPARTYRVGANVEMTDCGRIALDPDEQVTFTTPSGGEHDVARKDWGFYATASLNARLPEHGLRPALARNAAGRWYLLLVERGREESFRAYLDREGMVLVCWMDTPETLAAIEKARAKTHEQENDSPC